MGNWSWCQFWMYLTTMVLIVATAVAIIKSVEQVQETNRKFIEEGYEQVQTIGSTGWRWQKSVNR